MKEGWADKHDAKKGDLLDESRPTISVNGFE